MKLHHLIPATLAGLGLRLFFIARFPYVAGDSELYQDLARNLLDSGIYGIFSDGSLIPADMRMPGYPVFLALVEWLLGPGNERLMVVQAGVDVITCLLIAWLAAKFHPKASTIALWLAMLCPFTANYTTVPLSETLALSMTTIALLLLCEEHGFWGTFAGAVAVGLATMVRPESPLLLPAVGLALAWRHRRRMFGKALWPLTQSALALGAGLVIVLLPWGYRNWVQVGSYTVVSNPAALLPWEHGYTGYGDWANTWLVSSKDTYEFGFKFEDEVIDPAKLPPRSYDSEAERLRAVALIEEYNLTKAPRPVSIGSSSNWPTSALPEIRFAST